MQTRRHPHCLALLLLLLALGGGRAGAGEGAGFAVEGEALLAAARAFEAAFPNRFEGSPGNRAASDRIAEIFAATGLPHGVTEYETPTFVPAVSYLVAGGRRIPIHPLLPNMAEPNNLRLSPPTVPLVYVGRGSREELEGRDLEGALCLFEFDCGMNYLEVMKVGAVGCLFIEPERYRPHMAYEKVLNIPFTVPRYQVGRRDGLALRRAAAAGPVTVEVEAGRNRWSPAVLANHWVLVEGTDPDAARELVILYAALDTMHYCPGLPSGGQETVNLQLLLDLLDRYRAAPPRHSLLFLVFNSSHQNHAGAAEMITHLFGPEGDTLNIDNNEPSEERSLQQALETAEYILREIPRLARDVVDDATVRAYAEKQDSVGGRNFKLVDRIIRDIEVDIFTMEEARMLDLRYGEALADEEAAFARRRTELGTIVSLFNKVGRTRYTELTARMKDLLEVYRQGVEAQARAEAEHLRAQLSRLENVRAVRARFAGAGLQPLLAVGMEQTYGNEWLALRVSRHEDWAFCDWPRRPRLGALVGSDLGTEFGSRVRIHAEALRDETGIRWESGTLSQEVDARLFKDAPSPASLIFFCHRVPGFSLASPYDRNLALLSRFDQVEGLDPERVGCRAAFTRSLLDRLLTDEKTPENLLRKDGTPRLRGFAGASGLFSTRIQDGSSSRGPETLLADGLVFVPWTTESKVLTALRGGGFTHRVYQSDVGGRAFFYGLPRGQTMVPECYHVDGEGRVDMALDKGATALKYDMTLNPIVGYTEQALLAVVRGTKADLYDLVAPKSLAPIGKPILQTAKGGTVQRYATAGFAGGGLARGEGYACLWAEPRQPLKVLFTEDVSLLNAGPEEVFNPKKPFGRGYRVGGLDRQSVPHLAMRDILRLNLGRADLLERNAVTNDLIGRFIRESLKHFGDDARVEGAPPAKESLAYLAGEQRYGEFFARAMKSYGAIFSAYPLINGTLADMMKAVIFYLAVLLPFCFFLQKLLFSFVRIEAQIVSFVGLFLATYFVLYHVHPAFQVAQNPQVVLIAFTMMMLAGFVAFAMKGKFDYHMASFKERFLGEDEAGVLKLAGTAMLIGVTNMKRRRLRTTLTCITIVLITFTMLSFTSVSQSVAPTRVQKATTALYNGIFCSRQDWQALGEAKVEMLTRALGAGGQVLRRGFTVAEGTLLSDRARQPLRLGGLLALDANEAEFLGPLPLLAGRYFSGADAPEVLLSRAMARDGLSLDVANGAALPPDLTVHVNGIPLQVVGIFDGEAMQARRDLRGTAIVPQELSDKRRAAWGQTVEVQEGEEVPEGTFKDLDPRFYVVVPLGLRHALDIPVTSVSIRLPDAQTVWNRIMEFVHYSDEKVYFGARTEFEIKADPAAKGVKELAGTYYLGSGFATSIGGLSSLIIPLLVSATIIFNTMLGAVYERKKEIGIFNAIGLNPIHVALFFVAEAVVYGILGGVGGYLIGQVLAKIVVSFELLPDINLNYSSLTVVYVILFTIFVVVVSTIYPALQAMKTASSSSGRRGVERHDANHLSVLFPYSFTREMAIAVNAYLKEYFDRHQDSTVGAFMATPVGQESAETAGDDLRIALLYDVALAPYDLGVTQRVTVRTTYRERIGAFMVEAEAERHSGQESNWIGTNQSFLNDIRQYLLHWRALPRAGQEAHLAEGLHLFAEADADPSATGSA